MKCPAAMRRRLRWSGCGWRRTLAETFTFAFALLARLPPGRMLRRFWRWRRRGTRSAPTGLPIGMRGLRPDPVATERLERKRALLAYSPANGFHRDQVQQRKG